MPCLKNVSKFLYIFSNTVNNYLEFILVSYLMFEQVNKCVSSIFAISMSIASIKYSLSEKKLSIVVSPFIVSNLNYCNSMYYGISCSLLKEITDAQN